MSEPRTWEVGDLVQDPARADLPDGAVLVDKDGDPWKLSDGDWYIPSDEDGDFPFTLHDPYTVAWLPKENDNE